MIETRCITCGSPVQVVGGVTQSYEPITAHDRSYVRVVTENDRLREQVKVMRDALEYISKGTAHNPPLEAPELMSELANERLFDVSEARKALARCNELENE